MELANQKEGYLVWQKLNNLFEKEGFDRVLTFEFPIQDSAVYEVGIQHLNRNGVISPRNKRMKGGVCFYEVMPKKLFLNFPNTVSEMVKGDSPAVPRKASKKLTLYLGQKYGLYRRGEPEKGVKLTRQQMEYLVNLVDKKSIKEVLSKDDKEIPSGNHTRAMKILNTKIMKGLDLDFDLILSGDGYFLNSKRYKVIKDESLSTGLIALR